MEWIPALTTSGLLAVLLFLSRNLIITRLKSAVKHEYDVKLEELKSDIDQKQSQIELLRSGVVANIATERAVLFKRKLEAVDQLWEAVSSLKPAKNIAIQIRSLKFEELLKLTSTNEEYRDAISRTIPSLDHDKIKLDKANEARPYLSIICWAYFEAYVSIVFHAVFQVEMMRAGLNSPQLIDDDGVLKLAKKALPNMSDYIDTYGSSALSYLLDQLEDAIQREFRESFDGAEQDMADVERASEIIKLAEKLNAEASN